MTPRLRALGLTAHVVASVGWLGAVLTVLALAVVGLASGDAELVRAVHLAAEPVTVFVVVPLAFASLATGLVQALGTPWGLVRHYWVLAKLVLTVLAAAVLLMYVPTVRHVAAAGLGAPRSPTLVLHSGGALAVLLAATVLAVVKPRGTTGFGRRVTPGERGRGARRRDS